MSEDGFLSRWARRKQEVREGRAVETEPPAKGPAAVPPPQPSPGGGGSAAHAVPQGRGSAADAVPQGGGSQSSSLPPPLGEGGGGGLPATEPPTLADAQALTPESDFRRFVAPDVAPDVKNAAFKKLFADPRFNVMDGLDVYIDDYSKPDPMPPEMLRQLASAKFLRMFEEEEREPGTPETPAVEAPTQGREVANDPAAQTMAQSDGAERPDPAVPPPPPDHADPDLRLQQDDAARRPSPGADAE
jgi:hypothetical protein